MIIIDPIFTFILTSIVILFGITNCLYGYKIFKVLLYFWGFIFGCFIGGVLGQWLQIPPPFLWIVTLFGGIGALFLVGFFYTAAIFLLGAAFGYMISFNAIYPFAFYEFWFIHIIVAILTGIIAVILRRPIIIVATAFLGSWIAVLSAITLIKPQMPMHFAERIMFSSLEMLVIVIGWLLLGIAGTVFQLKRTSPEDVS